jgi:Tn3 transposase DDE domain
MSAVLDQLGSEGHNVDDGDVAHLSSARYAHINPCGKYRFNVEGEFNRKGLRPLNNEDQRAFLASKVAVRRAKHASLVDSRSDDSRHCYFHQRCQGDAGHTHKQQRRHQKEADRDMGPGSLVRRKAGKTIHKLFLFVCIISYFNPILSRHPATNVLISVTARGRDCDVDLDLRRALLRVVPAAVFRNKSSKSPNNSGTPIGSSQNLVKNLKRTLSGIEER